MRQYSFTLEAKPRGFHLITNEVMNHVTDMPDSGIFHLFIKHTSAGLTINENADQDVRTDLESFFNKIVPENMPFLKHTIEGPDDMPAHVKASLVGFSVQIPINNKQLCLGTWQGIYLCEFRNHASGRHLVASFIE